MTFTRAVASDRNIGEITGADQKHQSSIFSESANELADIEFTQHIVTNNFDGALSAYATDLDDDGDMDILGAAFNADTVAWWENDGNNSFTMRIIENTIDTPYSVYAIDLDSDGDKDVLAAGRWSRVVKWWENDGEENFTGYIIDGTLGYVATVFATDLDNDGDIDVLAGDADEVDIDRVAWYENNGNENFTRHIIDGDFGAVWSVIAMDINGDGDMDVLAAAGDIDTIAWWENDGSETFTKHVVDNAFDDARSVYAADIDQDSDIDILGSAFLADDVAWWENDGSENFTKHIVDSEFDGAISVQAVDLDGDGDLDILAAATDGNDIAWWENDGNQNFTKQMIIDNFGRAYSASAIDIDGDGDLDVLATAHTGDTIAWWEQAGSPSLDRAMWVWDPTQILHNLQYRSSFFGFTDAPHGDPSKKISTIFMQIPVNYLTDTDLKMLVHQFLSDADAQGLKVHYLAPSEESRSWLRSPNDFTEGREVIWTVIEFNQETQNVAERFKGIHLDIEPAELGNWETHKTELWDRFEAFLWYVSQDIDNYNLEYSPILFGVDLTTYMPWYGNDINENNRDDYKDILDQIDFITTMDYVDHALDEGQEGLITRCQDVLQYAADVGKNIYIGIETDNLSAKNHPNLYPWMTFYEEGWKPMEIELEKVQNAFSETNSFYGFALHYYPTYRDLTEFGGSSNSVEPIISETFRMTQGNTSNFTVNIEPGEYLVSFISSWSGSTVDMTLTDPYGSVITPGITINETKMTYYSGPTFNAYFIMEPYAGVWTINLYGASLPPEGENVELLLYSFDPPNSMFLPLMIR